MKFLKQTKETKRKISFFMALAMIISLLPASPVVKAAANATGATASNCNVYVNLDKTSEDYVKLDGVVTGGAIAEKEATTASVILAPKDKNVKFESVHPEKGILGVPDGNGVTIGSISLKKGDVTTSASVVVRKKEGSDSKKPAVAISSSSVNGNVIAEVSLSATGPSIEGENKNITGAVISIDGIKEGNDIEVAVVMEDGTAVTPSSKEVNVEFKVQIEGAIFKATSDGKVLATSSSSIKLTEKSTINLEITPNTDKEFDGDPAVTATGASVNGSVSGGIYKGTVAIGTEDVTVTINAKTKNKPATDTGFAVTYSGKVENADIAVSLSGNEFESGDKVNAKDTLDITITPKSGYYFAEGRAPKVTLKSENSAALVEKEATGNVYKVSVSSFKAATEITISGAAEKANVTNETKPESNVGAATLDTSSIQVIEQNLKDAFKKGDKVTAASAAAVTEALNKGGAIGVSLSVTTAGISANDAKTGKDAIVSDDKNAKNKAVALNILLTAICKDKDGKEVARVEVNELTKKVKIIIGIKGIFENIQEVAAGYERSYWVIRVHDGMTEKIKCGISDENIIFESEKFSTYVFYYEDVKENTDIPDTPDTTKKPNNPAGPGLYAPSGTATATPSVSPSTKPSAKPDATATPGVSSEPNATAVPSASPSGTEEPGVSSKPDTTKAPDNNKDDKKDNDNTGVKVNVGKKVTVNSSKYKVTSVSGTRAVQFTNSKKNAKNVVIPSTVKISGKNYKVTSIANNAFKNNKKLKKVTIGANVNKIGKAAFKGCKNLKSIVIKTKKLTAKKVGANAFKGINKKATFKVPKKKIKAYKKIVKAKGAAKTVKVKK